MCGVVRGSHIGSLQPAAAQACLTMGNRHPAGRCGSLATGRQRASVEGVFAAGDVLARLPTQQIAVATGTGAIAAIEAVKYLDELEDRAYPPRN